MKTNIHTNRYEYLQKEYTQPLTIGQMCTICKISLRSAKYLIDQGIIKAKISNKRTWKYQIPIESVIEYLSQRDTNGSLIPKGKLTSRKREANYAMRPQFKICCLKRQDNQVTIRKYFDYIFSEYPEILTRQDVTDMIGLHRNTVVKHIKANRIQEVAPDQIFKFSVINFVCSEMYLENNSRSESYYKTLKGFELWEIQESIAIGIANE